MSRYTSSNLPEFLDRATKYSIGLDEYFDRLMSVHETTSNYPPYNLVKISNVEFRLDMALAGFKKSELTVFTQDGKLFVEAFKEDTETDMAFVHKGLARRSFVRSWTMTDDLEIRSAKFEDGLLTIHLGKIVPEHHKRRDWEI